ncbi:hypothetical protein JTE90_025736 [Oedothorax gibbosus]|uniref:Uncharacterized protein n=1 Tax=Oedothorax gibbosus TaxID=931172 RepID=A0AAV6UVV0_9ARAC|nr:hypothetical protein JTE90_025736 [Oedothorax gibbosus]
MDNIESHHHLGCECSQFLRLLGRLLVYRDISGGLEPNVSSGFVLDFPEVPISVDVAVAPGHGSVVVS